MGAAAAWAFIILFTFAGSGGDPVTDRSVKCSDWECVEHFLAMSDYSPTLRRTRVFGRGGMEYHGLSKLTSAQPILDIQRE